MCPMPDGDEIISIGISPNEVDIEIGESYQMTRSVAPQNLASLAIWCSNDNSIARVSDSGIVTGIAEGRTTIYSTSPDNTVRSNDAVVTVSKKNSEGDIDLNTVESFPCQRQWRQSHGECESLKCRK